MFRLVMKETTMDTSNVLKDEKRKYFPNIIGPLKLNSGDFLSY